MGKEKKHKPQLHSFRFFIALLILISTLIPICLLGYLTYNEFQKVLVEQTNEHSKKLAEQVNISINQYIDGINNIIEVTSSQPGIIDIIERAEEPGFIENAKNSEDALIRKNSNDNESIDLTRSIIQSIKEQPYIFTAYIGTRTHHMFSNNAQYIYGVSGEFDCVTREWYTKAVSNIGSVIWTNPYIDRQTGSLVVTGAKAILKEDEIYGVFAIDIILDDFIKKIASISSDEISAIYVTDKENKYIVHQKKNMIGKSVDEDLNRILYNKASGQFIDDKSVYYFSTNDLTGWKVVAIYSKDFLYQKANVIKFLIYKIIGIIQIAIIIISLYVSKKINDPILSITNHLKIITSGNFETRVPEKLKQRKDEIGFLSKSVETMQKNISKLISDITDLNEEIMETQKELVITLGEIAETRSLETGVHIKRVAEYTYFLARKLGIQEDEARTIQLASTLHDIGKIGIPDKILNKPGKLTEEEFQIIQTHAAIGYNMLKRSHRSILKAAAIIARGHHEKFDGTGYPRKLIGKDIDFYARLVAVVDVFDALGTPRIYKAAWPIEQILDYMREQRGKHFDPEIVDIFLENIDSIMEIRNRFSDS